MKHHIDLFQKIQDLRLAASAIYDKLKASGEKEELIQIELEPFQTSVESIIRHTVENDLHACVRASREFHHHSGAFDEMAKFYIQKAFDAREHARHIEELIVTRMVKSGVTELQDEFSSATLVDSIDGSKVLNLR